MIQSRWNYRRTGQKQRLFEDFEYAAGTWDRTRRVIAKAEHSDGGENPRFVVTSLPGDPQHLYDALYCRRGDTGQPVPGATLRRRLCAGRNAPPCGTGRDGTGRRPSHDDSIETVEDRQAYCSARSSTGGSSGQRVSVAADVSDYFPPTANLGNPPAALTVIPSTIRFPPWGKGGPQRRKGPSAYILPPSTNRMAKKDCQSTV